VRAAGGEVIDTALRPLRYNTGPHLLNPHFFVIGDRDYDWRKILSEVPVTDSGA
jgi:3'-phosphoadenosine 5'-phosphosulfate (PAPS) 3'-phosphatase